jgi:hypothetical protein
MADQRKGTLADSMTTPGLSRVAAAADWRIAMVNDGCAWAAIVDGASSR